MTPAGRGNRFLAVAASLALHAGAVALAWPRPEAAAPAIAMQVTLLAPPAPAFSPTRPSAAGKSTARRSPATAAEPSAAATSPAPPAVDTSIETNNRETAALNADAAVEASSALASAAADPAATAGNTAAPADPDSGGEVLAALHHAFTAHFHYPPLARRQGWEGEVTLALRVETDGRLTGIHVVGSSGYRVLDNAAVATLQRTRALPLPGGTLDSGLDMLLPVQYRLLDARV